MDKLDEELLTIDISQRLPHGLKCRFSWDDSNICNVIGMIKNLFSDELNMIIEKPSAEEYEYTSVATGGRPILYPWEAITQTITIGGDTFIPLVEWAKISWPNNYPPIKDIKITDFGGVLVSTDIEKFFRYVYPSDMATIDGVQYLNKWMIDYRGLIHKKLAVSVKEFSENPYK